MKSLESQFLIASSHLLDSNFIKTVVLMLQHNEQGALGLVVNRPTVKTIQELWHEVSDSPCACDQPVYLGGPVSGPLMAVHTDESLGEMEILPGLFFAARKANLDELVLHDDLQFKLFLGHAGWGSGQLEREIEEGAWLTLPSELDWVFRDGEDLWRQACKRVGESVLRSIVKPRHVPEDPSLN